ncbi:MAG: YfhO family protein [Lachnospiraceae bacterium]|nr:YfhO family protein [Lachnospiraceae bacterium]
MKALAKKLKNIYLLSFCIPFLGILGIFIFRGIYPFGTRSFMFSDMYHQYVPFLTEFARKLREGESLAYSWYVGLGSDFTSIYAYYLASPVYWLTALCPQSLLIEYMTFFCVIKIGLCGVAFAFYLSRRFQTKDLRIVWFSVFYAMSGFIAAYNWNHMWLDCLWLAPFVILGLEELVKNGRYKLYCISLCASIFTNYYLSIMLCIFLVLYFLLQLFTNGLTFRRKLQAVLRFGLFSLLAGGMAGVLLFPVMSAMHVTEFHDISFPKKLKVYFNLLEVLARHVAMLPTERGLDHWPNIYCGVLAFVLVPVYFLHKKIPLKQRIGRFLLLAVMIFGFSVNMADFVWHGLNYPDSLPARQSFLYIFVILSMCFEAVYRNAENSDGRRIVGAFCGFLLLAACGLFVTTDGLTVEVMTCTWIFLAGYLVLHMVFSRHFRKRLRGKEALKKLTVYGKWAILVLVAAEAILNMEGTSIRTVQRAYYVNRAAEYKELADSIAEQDDGIYRFESTEQMTKNDGTLAHYPSASVFSSTVNGSVKDYYNAFGMGGSKVSYYYRGATPFAGALLGVKYTFAEEELADTALYEFVDRSGDTYVYRNRYALTIGFVLTRELTEDLEATFDHAGNAIVLQNNMAKQLCGKTLFSSISGRETETDEKLIRVSVEEDGHLYGIVLQKPDSDFVLTRGEETTELKGSDDYLLDLGFFTAGEQFSLEAGEEESISVRIYRLHTEALAEALAVLGEQPFLADTRIENKLTGTVDAKEDGILILSVPAEPGWSMYVDGAETEYEKFLDCFIAVPVTQGQHTIRLQYTVRGLWQGILCSLICLLVFVGIVARDRKWK